MSNLVDWDVKTLTAGDYTIEFPLEAEAYKNWKKKFYDETNPMCENAQFKLYLQNEIEDRINHEDFPDQGYDDTAKEEEEPALKSSTTLLKKKTTLKKDTDDPDDNRKKEEWRKVAQITFAYQNEEILEWLR